MKATRLQSAWIILLSALSTAFTCVKAIIKSMTGRTNRAWVDKTIRAWTTRLLRLAEVECKVYNPHAVTPVVGKPTILMCNHTSIYDIPLGYEIFPEHSIRMLAKKELSYVPLLASGMKAAEFPFVDRKNRTRAIGDLAKAKELMESGIILWMAPEGTRSKDGKLNSFKKGGFITAIQANATIIPVGIRGAFDILPVKGRQINKKQVVEIHIGKPIDASLYTIEQKNELAQWAYNEMLLLVGEQTTLKQTESTGSMGNRSQGDSEFWTR